MKLIAICSIGSYYSPWFPYTIAGIYNICDEIIVSNIGFNMNNPQPDVLVPLKRVSDEIKRLDFLNKVIELKNVQVNKLQTRMALLTQKQANDTHSDSWYDVRGVGLTAANEEAVRRGADWILKIDTDQAVYADIKQLRHFLHVFPANGLKFYQYEFAGDIGNAENHLHTSQYPVPYEDSVFVYRAIKGQFYGGGGAPALFLIGGDRVHTDVFHAAHLRNSNPVWLTDGEKFQHFYGRAWFSLYTNQYGKFCDELNEQAKKEAHDKITRPSLGKDSKPPEVCFYRDALDYIRQK